jgi:hypothetical protein
VIKSFDLTIIIDTLRELTGYLNQKQRKPALTNIHGVILKPKISIVIPNVVLHVNVL